MILRIVACTLLSLVLAGRASAQICTIPNTLTNGTNADATQVMANFNALLSCISQSTRSSIAGLTLSTAGSSSAFAVAVGAAADSTNASNMSLATPISKTTGAWAVGTGNGALDTGAIAAGTWYHVYLIKRTDTQIVDVLTSLSATAPTLPTNYTLFRRIGSMKTNASSQWIKFIQNDDEFLWDAPVSDAAALAVSTSISAITLTVPPGVSVIAKLQGDFTNTAAAGQPLLLFSPLTSAQASCVPTGNWSLNGPVANQYVSNVFAIRTSLAAQINAVAQTASNNSLYIITHGWIDTRGRFN